MKKIALTYLLLCAFHVFSQPVIGLGYSRYIGFNTNPILAQIIPFNNINPQLSNASLMFRSYNSNDNGIRAGYGLSLANDNDFQSMFVSVDNDRRRQIGGSRWMYFQGFGTALKIVSNNFNRATTAPISEEFSLSIGWHWGIEYAFNEIVSLSTEATFKLGVGFSNGSFLKIDPPFNIIAHFNLYN